VSLRFEEPHDQVGIQSDIFFPIPISNISANRLEHIF